MDKITLIVSIATGILGSTGLVEVIKAIASRRKNDIAAEGLAAKQYYDLLENVKKELLEKMARMEQDHAEQIRKKDEQIKSLQQRVAELEKGNK